MNNFQTLKHTYSLQELDQKKKKKSHLIKNFKLNIY